MYSVLYNLFFALKRVERKSHSEWFSKLCKKYYDLFDVYLNIVFRKLITVFQSNKPGVTRKKRNRKVVVSMTSFPARIDKVWLTIETILRQSVKADEIILWLAESQFDGFDSLPEQLKELCNRGLQIKFCEDLKSYKKYYYTFQEYKNDLVITVDDDMFFPKDTIKQMIRMHKKHPKDTISITSQLVPSIEKKPSEWLPLREQVISEQYAQPYTGAGVLYQPKNYPEVLYNKDLFKELAPYADDLWMYMISYISGIKITTIPKYRCFNITYWDVGGGSLFEKNGIKGENYNDIQWGRLLEYFGQKIAYKKT